MTATQLPPAPARADLHDHTAAHYDRRADLLAATFGSPLEVAQLRGMAALRRRWADELRGAS